MTEHSWNLYAAWDEALFNARLEAATTGTRRAVRHSARFPGLWVVEATA